MIRNLPRLAARRSELMVVVLKNPMVHRSLPSFVLLCWNAVLFGASSTFCPAYFHGGQGPSNPVLTLFPSDAPSRTIPLSGLPKNLGIIAFGPDGRALYGKNLVDPSWEDGITKIEFNPVRQSVVSGSNWNRPHLESDDLPARREHLHRWIS